MMTSSCYWSPNDQAQPLPLTASVADTETMSEPKPIESETRGGSCAPASGSAFKREYLEVPWTPSPEEKLLRDLAREYHERTEAYDSTVCTGPIVRGGIMPATPEQHALINRHARTVRDELSVEAARLGFTPKQWREAISNAAHEMPNADLRQDADSAASQPNKTT